MEQAHYWEAKGQFKYTMPWSNHVALQATSLRQDTAWYVWINLPRFGFFRLQSGVSRLADRIFPATRGLSRRTRHCRRRQGHGMWELALTVPQPIKKFSNFNSTRRFITVWSVEFSVTAYKFFTRYKISYNMSRPFKRSSSSTSKEPSREDTQLTYILLARSVKRVGTIVRTHIDSLMRSKWVSNHLMLLTYVVVFRCLARITTRYPCIHYVSWGVQFISEASFLYPMSILKDTVYNS
jgi:hypothetical protein